MHEHEVPDLDIAIAFLIRRTRRPAGHFRAVIVEDLRARSAGTGFTHRPKIGFLTHARAAGGVDANLIGPDARGFVVFLENRHPQPVLRNAEGAGDEIPREMDGFALEVVAEAEIAQHFEKRMVSGGVTDILQVVVLAAGANATLRGRGA